MGPEKIRNDKVDRGTIGDGVFGFSIGISTTVGSGTVNTLMKII